MTDNGPNPFVTDIEATTLSNSKYRDTVWTGSNLQLTVMSIPVDGEIGGEVHEDHDQFIRIEQGQAKVVMGASADSITFEEDVRDDWIALIPAGTYHNVTNTGATPLKLYSLYAPPEHAHGTQHETKADADAQH